MLCMQVIHIYNYIHMIYIGYMYVIYIYIYGNISAAAI